MNGVAKTFLEDGDKVIFTGYCQISRTKIGFGVLEGTIQPKHDAIRTF